jgi:hypothetical protein
MKNSDMYWNLDTKLERFKKCLELEHSNLFSEFNFFAEDNFYEFLHQRRKIIGKICSQFLVCTANLIDKVFLSKKTLESHEILSQPRWLKAISSFIFLA